MFTNYSGRILLFGMKDDSASRGGGDPTLQLGDAQEVGGGAETIPYFHPVERIIRIYLKVCGGHGDVFLDGTEDGFNF
jgi:hypothetical protein